MHCQVKSSKHSAIAFMEFHALWSYSSSDKASAIAGVIQPMKAIGELCRAKKVFFHTDAAQAIGKIPVNVNDMNIDLMSISGHKIYGPKGVGAIYIRRRPRVRLEAQISGGGQVNIHYAQLTVDNWSLIIIMKDSISLDSAVLLLTKTDSLENGWNHQEKARKRRLYTIWFTRQTQSLQIWIWAIFSVHILIVLFLQIFSESYTIVCWTLDTSQQYMNELKFARLTTHCVKNSFTCHSHMREDAYHIELQLAFVISLDY